MNITRKTKLTVIAMATAAASLFAAAPVAAAEPTNDVNNTLNISTMNGGFINGLTLEEENTTADMLSQKSGLTTVNGKTYYLDEFGQKVSGLVEADGDNYYFDEKGNMASGFIEIDGTEYYFSRKSGKQLYGKIDLDGTSYYLQEDDGAFLTGWQEADGQKTYYRANGQMVTDTVEKIDGKYYGFDKNGNMLKNTTVEEFDFDANGVGTRNVSAYQKIADAALAQLGRYQDCTMLVTNSLAAVGINFHGWPHEYLSLGPVTNDPVPGDIIVYQGHVAIYIGDGKAVHGGWNGNQTVVWSVQCSTPFVAFVHPVLP